MATESGLRITDIRIRRLNSPDRAHEADVSIQLHGALVLHDLRILRDERGLHVVMPVERVLDGTLADLAPPEFVPAPKSLEEAILAAYRGKAWRSVDASRPDWPPPDYLTGCFVLGQSGSSVGGTV